MLQILQKYYKITIGLFSFIVLVYDVINIISNIYKPNVPVPIINTVQIILIIQFPVCFFLIVALLLVNKKNNRREGIVIEGINLITLDYLFSNHRNISQKTKHFDIQSLKFIYEFKGTNFTSTIRLLGKNISFKRDVTVFPFVVAGDHNASFSEIDCYAYDLVNDSERNEKRILEKSSEGLCKIANFNFSDPLKHDQIFYIEVCYTWPNCVSSEKDYISASPLFFRKSCKSFCTELRFFDKVPVRIKKYIVDQNKKTFFLGELERETTQKNICYIGFIDRDIKTRDVLYIYVYDFKN
jgi:hypothetical protein